MTLFINVRRGAIGGGLWDQAYVLEGDDPSRLRTVPWPEVHRRVRARQLLIFCHGFNVSMQSGVTSAVRMEGYLKPADEELFLALLWPGDWHIPIINYSFEYSDARKSGMLLARFLDRHCAEARGISLGSHSLGGRVVLETLAAARSRVDEVCIAAPAVDADCLSKRFAPALSRVGRLTVLSSKSDRTLRWAYPLGDFFSDIFGDTDSALVGALGYGGARPKLGPPVHGEPIPEADGYDHGDYFPGPPQDSAPPPKWLKATAYWGKAVRGEPTLAW